MKPSLRIKKSPDITRSLGIARALIIASALTSILLTFSACSWSNSDGNPDGNSNGIPKSTYNPLRTPGKIEGLYVGTCQELFADMRKTDKETSDDELYRAAAVILYSDNRATEAATCCDNIKDANDKVKCKK